jgi:signal transduction histidine kinase
MDRTTERILEIARGVLSELDLEVVLERVLATAQELIEARYAALGVLNESRSELVRFLTRGIDEHTRSAIGELPHGRGILGALIADPRPLRLADVSGHPRSYGFPHAHPPMHSFLGVPILIGGEAFGNLYLTEKAGGGQFTESDEQSIVVLAEFAGVAIDHARRYTGEREHGHELQQTVARLEATTQIARALGGETDPSVVLELVAKRGRALVSARALLIELERGSELEVAAVAGELPSGIVGTRIGLADSVAAQAMRSNRVQRLEEELNRVRFQEHGLGRLGVKARGGLVVPLIFRGRSYGVLVAIDRLEDGPTFSADDAMLLESFATSAATAVATARSVLAERQRQRVAAAEAERDRWARELHDETLQSLSALRFGLSAARRSDRAEDLDRAVAQAVDQIEESIANLRGLITDLRPAALDEIGLQAAVEALVERGQRHGIEVDVSIQLAYKRGLARTRLSDELETALYRIIQEALTNAGKHGQATRAVVEIHEEGDEVHLLVRDDGRGFDAEQKREGFGLLGIHERVALLDGELEIDSAPERGTVIRARLPARRREPPAAAPQASPRSVGT